MKLKHNAEIKFFEIMKTASHKNQHHGYIIDVYYCTVCYLQNAKTTFAEYCPSSTQFPLVSSDEMTAIHGHLKNGSNEYGPIIRKCLASIRLSASGRN